MKLNNIKKSFDQRTIEPSPGSWDKLSQRLDNEQKTSKRPYLYWLGAVAAILIVALVAIPIMTKSGHKVPAGVVKQDKEIAPEKAVKESTGIKNRLQIKDTIPATNNVQETAIVLQKKPVNTSILNSSSTTLIIKKQHVVATVNTKQETTNKPVISNVQNEVAVQAIVKEIPQVKTQTTKLTAAQEADMLLERAMGKLKTQQTGVASKTIDPAKLLLETQWDIDAEKRNRVENILLDQFGKLKAQAVAIIHRN